jgi:hypothetical protein
VINSNRNILLGTNEVYQGVIKKVENKYCLKVNQKLYFELVDGKLVMTDQKSEKIFSKAASTE